MTFPHRSQTIVSGIGLGLLPWLAFIGNLAGLLPSAFVMFFGIGTIPLGLTAIIIAILYERRGAGQVLDAGAFVCAMIGCLNLVVGVFALTVVLEERL